MRRSYTSAIEAGLAKHYRTLEQEIMSDIVRRIKKAGKITSTADWQLNRLIFLGKSSEDLKKLVASAVQFDDAEVEKLYQAVIEEEYTVYRKQYEEITKEFIPYSENLWLQQITEAMIRQTKGDLINITRSMGFMLKQGAYTPLSAIYDDYLDQAIVDITSGAFDYNTVIRRVVGEMTRSGLRTDHAFSTNPTDYTGIDYPSGWHNRIDVAARRAILTGVSQLTDQITRKNAEILGVDRFEVSWHVGARPEHAEWQGKVYTMDQLEDICGLGTGAGLLGWNCRHSYYLFFPGSERQYTDEWLEEQREAEAVKQSFRGREYNTYEATQKQRRMETNMRAQRSKVRLLEEGEADPDDIVIAKCKYQAQLDEYKEFSRRFRLPEQKERIYADLKGRVAPSQATMARTTPEMLHNATVDRQMYDRRKIVLGEDMPSVTQFRQMKYKDAEAFASLERQYKTFREVAEKDWTDEAKERAISAYREIRAAGFEVSTHFLARQLEEKRNPGGEVAALIEIMKKPANYTQVDGREVKWYNNYALIYEPKTHEYVSVVYRKNAKKEWILNDS